MSETSEIPATTTQFPDHTSVSAWQEEEVREVFARWALAVSWLSTAPAEDPDRADYEHSRDFHAADAETMDPAPRRLFAAMVAEFDQWRTAPAAARARLVARAIDPAASTSEPQTRLQTRSLLHARDMALPVGTLERGTHLAWYNPNSEYRRSWDIVNADTRYRCYDVTMIATVRVYGTPDDATARAALDGYQGVDSFPTTHVPAPGNDHREYRVEVRELSQNTVISGAYELGEDGHDHDIPSHPADGKLIRDDFYGRRLAAALTDYTNAAAPAFPGTPAGDIAAALRTAGNALAAEVARILHVSGK